MPPPEIWVTGVVLFVIIAGAIWWESYEGKDNHTMDGL